MKCNSTYTFWVNSSELDNMKDDNMKEKKKAVIAKYVPEIYLDFLFFSTRDRTNHLLK